MTRIGKHEMTQFCDNVTHRLRMGSETNEEEK